MTERLIKLLQRLALHGDSSATATLDRDTAQALSSLVTCVQIFRNAAGDWVKRKENGRTFVDRNMPSGALDALGQLIERLEQLEAASVESSDWHRQPVRS